MTPYETLEDFFLMLVDDTTEEGFAAASVRHPEAGEALARFLEQQFVLGEAPEPLMQATVFWKTLGMILSKMDEAERDQLVDTVVFRVANPEAFRVIAPLLRVAIPPERMEDLVIDKLKTGTPLEQRNAYDLDYYLFHAGGSSYRMSPAARAEFDAFAAELAWTR